MSAPANHAAPAQPPVAVVSPLVAALLALAVAVIAVLVSLAIYGGQTNARIDSARTEVLAEVRALRADVRAHVVALRGAVADLRRGRARPE